MIWGMIWIERDDMGDDMGFEGWYGGWYGPIPKPISSPISSLFMLYHPSYHPSPAISSLISSLSNHIIPLNSYHPSQLISSLHLIFSSLIPLALNVKEWYYTANARWTLDSWCDLLENCLSVFYGIRVRFIIARFYPILILLKQQVPDFRPKLPRFISHGSS